MSAVSNLQHAINRFYGVSIGSPIAEDGTVGNETQSALQATVTYVNGIGYDLGDGAFDTSSFSAISGNAQPIADWLNGIADTQGFTYDVAVGKPSSGGGGRMLPTVPKLPGVSPYAANITAAWTNLPTWVKWGGYAVIGLVAYTLIGRAIKGKSKPRAMHGVFNAY